MTMLRAALGLALLVLGFCFVPPGADAALAGLALPTQAALVIGIAAVLAGGLALLLWGSAPHEPANPSDATHPEEPIS